MAAVKEAQAAVAAGTVQAWEWASELALGLELATVAAAEVAEQYSLT